MPETFLSKIKVGSADPAIIRDANSLHYRGHYTAGLTVDPNTSTIYTGTPTGLSTIKEQDFITYGTENINLVCTNISSDTTPVITWTSTSEATAENALSGISVNGVANDTVVNHVAPVILDAAHALVLKDETEGTTQEQSAAIADNTLPDGTRAATQLTTDDSSKLATTEFVHNLFDDIANPLIFKGDATLTADSEHPDTAAITVSGTIKKGYTYKITSITASPTYTGKLKVGDTIIADKDNPVVTAAWVAGTDWTVVPSGDENDGTVMSVTASAASGSNLTVTVVDSKTGQSTITEAGTITVGVDTGYTIPADTSIANWNTAFARTDGLGNTTATTSVSLESTSGATSLVAAHMGDVTAEEDPETLYIDTIYVASASVATYTAPTQG